MATKSLSARAAALIVISCLSATALIAQTAIKLPKNRYTPEQDVQIGREAAAEIRQQYPIIKDERITRYLTRLGDRLVAAAPAELNKPVYEYSFTPVNLKEINAFALPGGPMFVQRGMFTAAATEGEVVGVMAHELSHVLLRHGTANASKAQNPWLQLGQLAGQLGGAVVGGGAGAAIAQSADFGLGTLLLRYSRDFEKQADLLGAQIMARAGYDPRALAHMFETIARESKSSGGGGPQWMSSHPDPGNRTVYITREAEALTIASAADDRDFSTIKTAFAGLPAPLTMAELAKRKTEPADSTVQSVGTPGQPVPRPAAEYRSINGGRVFQADVPVELDFPADQQRHQDRPGERLRPVERANGLQPRHRVRRGAGGHARSAGSHHHLAESGCAEQPAAQARRRTAGPEDLPALGHRHAARQSVAARGAGADWALYDVPRGRDALLLPDDRA